MIVIKGGMVRGRGEGGPDMYSIYPILRIADVKDLPLDGLVRSVKMSYMDFLGARTFQFEPTLHVLTKLRIIRYNDQ